MLGKDNIRMLSYIEKVTAVTPIKNADRLEAVHINGWVCVCGKGEFHEGDLGVFFEIDSKLPEVKPFTDMDFLASKHYKIKSQKIRGVISQGLFMPISAFDGLFNIPAEVHADCTQLLGVTYSAAADNKRKSGKPGEAAFKAVKARHPKFFANPIVKRLVKYNWFKAFIMATLGKKAKKLASKKSFPVGKFQGVSKTDSERIENIPYLLGNGETYIATEKLDGTSTTIGVERKKFGKFEEYICSRNVRMLNEEQECYHDYNIYWEMNKKYSITQHLKDYLINHPEMNYVFIQGESVGSVQGNPLKLTEDDFYAFSFICDGRGILSPYEGRDIVESWGMKWVPIIGEVTLPDTMEEMKKLATANSLVNPSVLREGIVYRSVSHPNEVNFKNVSNEFLLSKKY